MPTTKIIQFSKPTISLESQDYKRIRRIIESGWVSIGKNVEKLENVFRRRFKVNHAIACSSCTQGLIIALKAAGWRNKRIAVPAFTWPSTIFAIESNIGNTPVFCDIDPKTWFIDLSSINESSYDAVIPVDIFGNEAYLKTNKPMIYDAAHGFNLKDLGHRGIAEVVSLSFTKLVSASEGGMILTNDDNIAKAAYELRRLSSRMAEVNAMIALRSLKNYEKNQRIRLNLIRNYINSFDFDFKLQKIPICTNNSVFSILLPSTRMRNCIAAKLRKFNIEFKIYYEPLIEGLPNTDMIFSHILSLPIHSGIVKSHRFICDLINSTAEDIVKSRRHYSAFDMKVAVADKTYLKESGYLKNYLRKEK